MSWEESSGLRDMKPTTTTPSGERGSEGEEGGNGGGGFEEEVDMGEGGGRVKTRIEGGFEESMVEKWEDKTGCYVG
ncbi:hypothetical protein V6N12_004558 [Hibiscus sabdariffa]|uniref:Uncharacterized protein n=1 Tax=Hibiscus sabdariffa TaxID=183260 RepID=A0ABR2CP33_9ROSI